MANYEKELANFKKQWNLPPTYDLNQLAKNVYTLRFADSFLTGASVDNSPAGQYVKWFSRTLSLYFATNIMPNEKGKYISSFDAQAFYDSFKTLVQAKYDADAQEKNEDPLQVGKVVTDALKPTIQNTIANCKRKYQKTLPAIWTENLKEGTMDMDQLHALTKRHYDAMDKAWNKNEITMAGSLTNVIAGYEAMKQLRDSRKGFFGWLWKLFNGAQNRQEEAYFNELSEQIGKLSKHFDINKISADLTGKTVFGKNVKATEKAKEAPNAKVSPEKSKDKAVKMEPVAARLNSKMDRNFLKGLMMEWTDKFPDDSNLSDITLEYAIGKPFLQGVQKLNQAFDTKIANGGDPKKEMERVVKDVFKLAVSHSSEHIKDLSVQKKAEIIKVIAKGTIENCTAAAIYPKELGDVVETCLNQSAFQYKAILKEGKDYLKEIGKYDIADIREPAFGNGNLFAETGVNKSSQVSGQPQINVPTINNKK